MKRADPGRDLAAALSMPDGPQRATTRALLLLVNALHLIEPELDHPERVRVLGDGTLPGGDLLMTLNVLSAHPKTTRAVGPGDRIRSEPQPATATRQARTTLRALGMLLQTERCGLCEAKPAARDQLVNLYLARTVGMVTYGNLGKERSAWRKRFTGAGLFGDPPQMRAFVAACLLAMLGKAAASIIVTAADPRTVAGFRTVSAQVQARLREQVPDALAAGVLGSMFDFSEHSNAQVSATLKSLGHASLAPLFKQDTGELAKITADMLPTGLLSGRSPPR